jgi:hypothetical protein
MSSGVLWINMKLFFHRLVSGVLPAALCIVTAMLFAMGAPAVRAQVSGVLLMPSNDKWPFARNPTGIGRIETDDAIGLYNSHIGLLIRKKDATILGIWDARGWNLVAYQNATGTPAFPMWSLELMPRGAQKPLAVNALNAVPVAYEFAEGEDGRTTLQMKFAPAQAGESRCAVTAEVSLGVNDEALHWRAGARMLDENSSVWSVRYPLVQVRAVDESEGTNQTVFPYRQGHTFAYGKSQPRYDLVYPYPGPGAKFQFLAAYGEKSRRGFYLVAEDGEGYDKQMVWQNQPGRNAVVFSIEHIPANRGVAGTGFSQPYDVVTQPFEGDWYDAARLYRAWWVKQIWASQGLLRTRKDVPDWLRSTPVMTRPSTTVPQRTVAGNVGTENELQQLLDGAGFTGIWYGVYENISGKEGLDYSGHGHLRAVRADVQNAVLAQKARGIHHLAYLQSVVYDPLESDPQDAAQAAKYAAIGRDGKPIAYGGRLGYNMDRSKKWWQDRVIAQAEKAVAAGFDGIYLDSFGKSSAECFAPDHGHPLGGGNTGIAGQREMARRVLQAIRKINPNAVLSGEDPVEDFRDVLQTQLLSANLWPGYLPLYRVIWGDYSLEYGRVLRPSKAGIGNLIPEMAALFVNGSIMGRIYTEGDLQFSKPEYSQAKTALLEMTGYTRNGIEYLRYGEYLRPLQWDAPLPEIEVQESIENSKVTLPAVLHSVTRSYADGSVGMALVNIGAQKLDLQVPIDPSLRNGQSAKSAEATLWRMDSNGKRTRIAQGKTVWKQPLSLQPNEIAFLILQ